MASRNVTRRSSTGLVQKFRDACYTIRARVPASNKHRRRVWPRRGYYWKALVLFTKELERNARAGAITIAVKERLAEGERAGSEVSVNGRTKIKSSCRVKGSRVAIPIRCRQRSELNLTEH